MRTLHINPRKFQEPFQLLQIDDQTDVYGVENFKVKKRILMFGSIMNKALTYAQSTIDDSNNTLSIKIVYQKIVIKPKDRIIYNNNQYIVTQVERDFYNQNEIIFQCNFEKTIQELKLNYKLNFKLVR